MKKIILLISIITLIILGVVILRRTKKSDITADYTVGILQTASHPALDASREGFVEELKNKLGNKVEFVIQNAQGSVSHAHAIAQQFQSNKKFNGFFAIATPAAQAISSIEKERPIFIAAVTDPSSLGIIHPKTNVCGTRDMIDVKSEVSMLKELVPNAKTVGIIYTSGETNSVALVKQMHLELEAQGLIPLDFALSNESDMQALVELACRKVDVILTPTDNTVASTIKVITAITLKNKKPLIVSDNMLVKFGALAAKGVDYKVSGKRVAQLAYEVLVENKKPYELPIEDAKSEQIFINKTTLDLLGLTVPESIKEHVVLVS